MTRGTADNAVERGERVAALVARAKASADAVIDTQDFAAWARQTAKFHRYSLNNVFLILTQMPDATQVAGYGKWQAMGRQVAKGEKGITILAPMVRKTENALTGEEGRRVSGFGTATVFDVSQTEGADLSPRPTAVSLTGMADESAALYALLERRAAELGIAIVNTIDHPTANGAWHGMKSLIELRENLDPAHRAKTLAHEMSHAVAGHGTASDSTKRAEGEIVAEASAYAICAWAGMKTDAYSGPYLAGWSRDKAVVAAALPLAAKVAGQIIGSLESYSGEDA